MPTDPSNAVVADGGGVVDVKPARATSRKRPPSDVIARSPHTPASVKAGPTTPTAVDVVAHQVRAHDAHGTQTLC